MRKKYQFVARFGAGAAPSVFLENRQMLVHGIFPINFYLYQNFDKCALIFFHRFATECS